MNRLAGPLITTLILAGVGVILLLNLDLGSRPVPSRSGDPAVRHVVDKVPVPNPAPANSGSPSKGNFREYPIGEEVERNGLRVAAVWLPPIEMDGNPMSGSDILHIEADVKATEANPQGFALGEFVPYLKISYEIRPADGPGPVLSGELTPMVASDGLHYGASVAMPKAGEFLLSYTIQPPSAGGLGRHSDPITGVAPWWKPFTATFDWDYEGPDPKAGRSGGS